jgi:DNA-binding MarR family transcriptional regulator
VHPANDMIRDRDGGELTAAAPQPESAVLTATSPPVDVTRLRVAIARLSRRLRKHDVAGLTPTQLSALSTVDKAGPVRLGELAAAERIAPSTLTRLVTALEEFGYVRRCAVPGDARASTVAVTDRGHAVLERIREETTSLLRESLLTLPADQLAALAAALPALEHIADSSGGESPAQ